MADQELVKMIMSGGGKGAQLRRADLTYASLEYADLRIANLEGANLRGVDLKGANLAGAILKGANFTHAGLTYAILKGARLQGAYLKGARLVNANLVGANLTGANLEGANLEGVNLSNVKAGGAILRGADLAGANLKRADLSGTQLVNANLVGANLTGANLEGAILRGADLYDANFKGADLTGADLTGADLTDVEYDAMTIWPEGFTPPGRGRMASRNRKASTMVPIKISSVSHKEKFPFNADDFRRNPDESLRRAANRFLESVKNEILYCTVYVDGEMHTTVPITVDSFDTTKIVSKLQNSFSRLGNRIPDQGKGTITFDFKFVPFSSKSEMLVDVDEMASDDMLNLMAKSDIILDVSIKTIYGDVWGMSVEDSPVTYFDLEINVPEILSYRD